MALQPVALLLKLDRLVERCERDGDESWSAVQTARHQGGDVDVEAHDLVGARGIRLDERRTPFRIPRPTEIPSRLGGGAARRSHGDREHGQPDRERHSPDAAGIEQEDLWSIWQNPWSIIVASLRHLAPFSGAILEGL